MSVGDKPENVALGDLLTELQKIKHCITDFNERLEKVESGEKIVKTGEQSDLNFDPEDDDEHVASGGSGTKGHSFSIPQEYVTEFSQAPKRKPGDVKKLFTAYQSLKDSVSKIRLDNELMLSDQKFNIKDTSKRGVAVTRKSGHYLNTTWKVLIQLCADGEISDSGADKLYVCMRAHLQSLSQELQQFLFEGTDVPKQVLSNVTALHDNPVLEPEAVDAFKTACEVYSSAEKAKSATASANPVRGNRGGYRQFTPNTKGDRRPFYQNNQNYRRPFNSRGSDRFYEPRDQRDIFDSAVRQSAAGKP